VKDTHFPVKGQKTSNPGQIQDTVKSITRSRNKGLSWKIQDGWSPSHHAGPNCNRRRVSNKGRVSIKRRGFEARVLLNAGGVY